MRKHLSKKKLQNLKIKLNVQSKLQPVLGLFETNANSGKYIDLTRGWTESDHIISSDASKSATGIIVGVAICLGTRLLEILRIGARSTGTRNSIRSAAAVGICVEGETGALAPDDGAIRRL